MPGTAGRRLIATRTGSSGGPQQQAAEQQLGAAIRKARWLSGPVGGLAGLFGSLVGVGGGVLITPILVSTCRAIPQR